MPSPKRRQPALDQIEPRRICIIKPSALGDIVQTLPVLSMLRRRFPEAHIAWVVKDSLAGVLEGHEELDDLVQLRYPRGRLQKLRATWRLLRRLRRGRFDLTIDLQGLFRSALMSWASGAPRRLGLANAREGAPLVYTDTVDVPWRLQPAVENYRQLVAPLGCDVPAPPARVPVREQHRRFARAQLAGLPRPLLAIHPGAQWETKRWPPENFAALARRGQRELGAGVVLVGGPGEGALCRAVAGQLPAPATVDLAEQTDLLQLAAVAAEADVFLSGDTGPMHLAAAMGTPVVALFTCTSPLRAGPRGLDHRVVTAEVPCAGSYLKTCPALVCMQELTPQRVWPALHLALSRPGEGRKEAG